MSQQVLIVVTGRDNVPSCLFRDRLWPRLKQRLMNSTNLLLVEIELEKIRDIYSESFAKLYPPNLPRYIHWFPSFILCTHSSWVLREALNVEVFGGRIDHNEETGQEELSIGTSVALTEDNICQWINKILVSKKFTNCGIIYQL